MIEMKRKRRSLSWNNKKRRSMSAEAWPILTGFFSLMFFLFFIVSFPRTERSAEFRSGKEANEGLQS